MTDENDGGAQMLGLVVITGIVFWAVLLATVILNWGDETPQYERTETCEQF